MAASTKPCTGARSEGAFTRSSEKSEEEEEEEPMMLAEEECCWCNGELIAEGKGEEGTRGEEG